LTLSRNNKETHTPHTPQANSKRIQKHLAFRMKPSVVTFIDA